MLTFEGLSSFEYFSLITFKYLTAYLAIYIVFFKYGVSRFWLDKGLGG